jgi:predicted transcriptional regulator
VAKHTSDGNETRGAESGKSQRMSAALIRALDNATRREALRFLHRRGCACSASQLSRWIDTDATNISYHLKILSNLGAVSRAGERLVRSVPEKLFASEVSGHRQIVAILADTEQDDEWLRR